MRSKRGIASRLANFHPTGVIAMKQKAFLGTAIAAALLLGANVASACAISAWSSATGLAVADTGEPSAGSQTPTGNFFARYSARCGLRVNAQNKFVQDNTPQNETSYRVRFYYYTGDISGSTEIFRARNAGGNNVFRVTHDGATITVGTAGTATTDSLTVNDNRWYMVSLDWSQASGVTGRIRGSGARPCTAPATSCANNEEIIIAATTTEQIQDAQLGLLATSGVTVTNQVFFDEFDSRRTTTPPRLRRGDSNNDGVVNALDGAGVLAEFNGTNIRPGQPDCNENGDVDALDGACVLAIFNNPVPDQ